MVYGNETAHTCGHSDDEEEEAGAVIYIAVIMCALGSISQNFGNNVMSLGHRKKAEVHVRNESKRQMSISMDEKSEESLAPMMEDGKREAFVLLAGRAVFVVGALLIFGSFLTGAPIAVLAPMEAIQFVSNMVFAKYVIGEDPTKIMYFGALGIVLGLMLIVFGSPHVSCLHPIRNMVNFYSPPEGTAYLVYLVFAGVGLVVSHTTYVKMQAARKAEAPWAGVPPFVEPLCYATSSTLVGTQSVLFVKCIGAILLSMQADDGDTPGYTFTHWFTYTCVVCWLITVAVWITRLDASLQKYNPLFIIPVMQMGFIFFASISGGIYFHEVCVSRALARSTPATRQNPRLPPHSLKTSTPRPTTGPAT